MSIVCLSNIHRCTTVFIFNSLLCFLVTRVPFYWTFVSNSLWEIKSYLSESFQQFQYFLRNLYFLLFTFLSCCINNIFSYTLLASTTTHTHTRSWLRKNQTTSIKKDNNKQLYVCMHVCISL